MLVRVGLAAVAGLALSLAFEPVAVPWVIPFCVAAFVLLTRDLRPRRGFLVGLVFGAAFYFTHIFWMRAVGVPAWIALSLLETFFYAVLGLVSSVVLRHRLWPVWFAAAWTTAEVVRSGYPLGGMPWGRLAFAVVDTPMAPALPYVGAVGVSFALALLGALLAAVFLAAHGLGSLRVTAGSLVGLCLLVAVPVAFPWDADDRGEPGITVAVVQGLSLIHI